ncbi:diadenylate cyclase CdaA [Porphyromonas sp.]|uniref:diadenylate cyclase CdaA n=1 Tax=Porphyromonas sp. TaxID=1924944 RepID=UPI002632BD8D|nr:diadenylate cyclase CdaA [uncultured Porphyromonas sp.]
MTLDWLSFTLVDLFDIILSALLFYYVYRTLRATASRALILGIFTFVLVWVIVSKWAGMILLGGILDELVGTGMLILVIIFQEEIRRFLITLGSTHRWRFLRKVFKGDESAQEEQRCVAALVLACMNMARKKVGALIAIEARQELTAYLHTGEVFKAEINARLIENIFFKNSPLHDGAMIIVDNDIRAAGCILPVSNDPNLSKDLGLRHRSALGLSQATDCLVIVISEERGKISLAQNGVIDVDVDIDTLRQRLDAIYAS